MDLELYFDKINIDEFDFLNLGSTQRLGHTILTNCSEDSFPALEDCQIAIVGVPEERLAVGNKGCSLAPNEVRKYLYRLFPHKKQCKICDLGNLRIGASTQDTYKILADILTELLKMKIIPIILGGSGDIAFANYCAYENIGQIINAFAVDSRIDLGEEADQFNSQSYLTSIVCREPNYLFGYTHVAYQQYFVSPDVISLMHDLYFDSYRVGVLQDNLDNVEPLVRGADMVSIDVGSVRGSDAPGNGNCSPHGLYGEQLCKITRYAGMSDKCSSIGFYETNPLLDSGGRTSHMVAHAIWYFIDGYMWRKHDYPYKEKESYKKFYVTLQNDAYTIVFYKSKKSERWWMEVPCSKDKQVKYERHYLVPCTYEDYQIAMQDRIPDRWLLAYNKIML